MQTPSYRIGNDLTILWSITDSAGNPIDLNGKTIHLYATTLRGREEVPFELVAEGVSGKKSILKWLFLGKDQHILGPYTLTFEIQDNKSRTIMRDYCKAFDLVAKTCLEKPLGFNENFNDKDGILPLSTKLDIYRVQPIVPVPCRKTPDDGNDYWEVDGECSDLRVTGDSAYQLAVKKGQTYGAKDEEEWIRKVSLRVFDGGNAFSTFGGARHIDCGGAERKLIEPEIK